MKIGLISERLIERIVVASGLVPFPMIDTHLAVLRARTIMVATKLGVFEALQSEKLTADEVSARCHTHAGATEKLLNALVGAGYLASDGETYALAPVVKKWLLKESPHSLHDNILYRFMEWDWIEHFEEFVRSGKPLHIHEMLSDDQWELYQRGMRSLANVCVSEVVRHTPVPAGARDMLDIGGSHGFYSVALCRRHRGLRAVILDLPKAVEPAAAILAAEAMGDRVTHRCGNVLTDDLGTEAWDLVFACQVVHHFDEQTNRELARRVARALRPGGIFVIQDVIRPNTAKEAGRPRALLDLFFAVTSEAGTWSFEDLADWQRQAGLVPRKPIRFRLAHGAGQQAAVKPANGKTVRGGT